MKNNLIKNAFYTSMLLLAGLTTNANAGSLDLATVPPRESVQLTIYNSADLTLVKERRTLSFKPGVNPLQFSWANTLIDPTSVAIAFPGNADRLDVLDTTFPHDRPQQLYWNVRADEALEATIEISYFTSGISWAADYQAVASVDESALRLDSFVRVDNRSGEDYADAQVRLVVGKINLVQRIAELARISPQELDQLGMQQKAELRSRVLRSELNRFDMAAEAMPAAAPAPKQVEKQGLSDYFIYTIEGTETVPNGWSKRLRSFSADAVPLDVEYRYRPREYGDRLVRIYTLRNDTESGLGTTPLPDGQVRVFRENADAGLSFLAGLALNYVPIGDAIELNLGVDPEVGFELIERRRYRDNLWLRLGNTSNYRRPGETGTRNERSARVAGWDAHAVYEQRVHNYGRRPIRVEVRRIYDGDVRFVSELEPALHDYRTVQYQTRVGAGERIELRYEVITGQGYNSRQNRVKLENGRPAWP